MVEATHNVQQTQLRARMPSSDVPCAVAGNKAIKRALQGQGASPSTSQGGRSSPAKGISRLASPRADRRGKADRRALVQGGLLWKTCYQRTSQVRGALRRRGFCCANS